MAMGWSFMKTIALWTQLRSFKQSGKRSGRGSMATSQIKRRRVGSVKTT